MKKLLLIIFSFTLILNSVFAAAFKAGSEPEGFRGFKWGSELSSINNMEYIETKPDPGFPERSLELYRHGSDTLKIGEAKLDSITYEFLEKKLQIVSIIISGKKNLSLLKKELFKRYGKGISGEITGAELYTWGGDNTRMILFFNNQLDKGVLDLISKKFYEEVTPKKQ